MSRNVITYSNLYKDPQKIKKSLEQTITHRRIDNFSVGDPILCSDFQDLASSIIGANVKNPRYELYGHPVTLVNIGETNYELKTKWTCLVFLTDNNDNPGSIEFLRHSKTGVHRIGETPVQMTDQHVIDGYTGGTKLVDALITDVKEKKWITDTTVNITNNLAVFFRSDTPYTISEHYQKSGGIMQVFHFGDDNAD